MRRVRRLFSNVQLAKLSSLGFVNFNIKHKYLTLEGKYSHNIIHYLDELQMKKCTVVSRAVRGEEVITKEPPHEEEAGITVCGSE